MKTISPSEFDIITHPLNSEYFTVQDISTASPTFHSADHFVTESINEISTQIDMENQTEAEPELPLCQHPAVKTTVHNYLLGKTLFCIIFAFKQKCYILLNIVYFILEAFIGLGFGVGFVAFVLGVLAAFLFWKRPWRRVGYGNLNEEGSA